MSPPPAQPRLPLRLPPRVPLRLPVRLPPYAVRRVLRRVQVLVIAALAVVVALATSPGLVHKLGILASRVDHWAAGLGWVAVAAGLTVFAVGLAVVAVSTEREFSQTDEFYQRR